VHDAVRRLELAMARSAVAAKHCEAKPSAQAVYYGSQA
jgi:hypothetical protein